MVLILPCVLTGCTDSSISGSELHAQEPPVLGATENEEAEPAASDHWFEGKTPVISAIRQSNTACLAGDAPADPVTLTPVFGALELSSPVAMVQVPGSSTQPWFLAEKGGRVLWLPANDDVSENDKATALQLDVHRSAESGINSLVVHPDFQNNRQVFISYGVSSSSGQIEQRLSRFITDVDSKTLNDEVVLMRIPKDNPLHFGGALAFGPDGYLYFSVGDDGDNLDGDQNPMRAQESESAYGTILRLDVNTTATSHDYVIPPDNPNLDGSGPSLAWAIGFRNPWRMSFDREAPHDLWVSNVGSHKVEEISVVNAGENHGWPMCEGPCDPGNELYVDPVYSYPNKGGAAVIGGYRYRGSAIPELSGKYVFADYVKQQIYTLDPVLSPSEPLYVQPLNSVAYGISGFAESNDGELYVLAIGSGGVHRIERNQTVDNTSPPDLLSDTGCFASLEGGQPVPAPGVIDYSINQKFWSDGASKRRQIALPDGEVLDTSDPDNWQIPAGGLTIKHFYWQKKIIETRFLVRHDQQRYSGYTYAWDDAQNEAALVPASGQVRELDGLTWEYPSRSDCMRCHGEQAGFTLSLESRQLNVTHEDTSENQIDRLAAAGYLDTAQPEKLEPFPTVAVLDDASIALEERASSWLHVNCSSCHRGIGSAGRATWDARYASALAEKRLCGQAPFEPIHEVFGAIESIVTPGDHELSTAWLRASSRETPFSMPPISSRLVDEKGMKMLAEWIDALQTCPPLGDTLPGRVLAENYDNSFDLTQGNDGQSADCDRQDDVDMEPSTDNTGRCSVGWTVSGEWLDFDVHVSEARDYTLTLRVANGVSPNGRPATLDVRIGDTVIAEEVDIPNAGWRVWQSIVLPAVGLPPGNHVMRVTFNSGFVNLNHIDVQ